MAKVRAGSVEVHEVSITLPFGNCESSGHQGNRIAAGNVEISSRGTHINVQLGAKAARAFARVRNGFREAGVRLPDGRPVWSNADALRYLMETLADAAE